MTSSEYSSLMTKSTHICTYIYLHMFTYMHLYRHFFLEYELHFPYYPVVITTT